MTGTKPEVSFEQNTSRIPKQASTTNKFSDHFRSVVIKVNGPIIIVLSCTPKKGLRGPIAPRPQ